VVDWSVVLVVEPVADEPVEELLEFDCDVLD